MKRINLIMLIIIVIIIIFIVINILIIIVALFNIKCSAFILLYNVKYRKIMIRKLIYITIMSVFLNASFAIAGSEDNEELKKSKKAGSADECFEGVSRAMFKFNHTLDGAIFKPVAKGYRILPTVIRKGTGNAVDNLRSLLTISNNILRRFSWSRKYSWKIRN